MEKLDLKKELKHLYAPSSREPVEVNVPEMNFLMLDGEGDPNGSREFAEAVDALFPVSYAIKFMVKKGPLPTDYGVMPLEGLWWADEGSRFQVEDKSSWKWTLMVMQPEFVTKEMVENAILAVAKKKSPPVVTRIRFETFPEGRCAQILHIGPFSEEGPTVDRLHRFIEAIGTPAGKHHEIYLSDTRRSDPSKWRTIIRQPFK